MVSAYRRVGVSAYQSAVKIGRASRKATPGYTKETIRFFLFEVHSCGITIPSCGTLHPSVQHSENQILTQIRSPWRDFARCSINYTCIVSQSGICSVITRPISREAVAAGEGALHT